MLRLLEGRSEQPSAIILDARTLQSTPESGARAGYDSAKKKLGTKVHAAVDTLGNLLALAITAANEQDRAQVATLAEQVQQVTGATVELAYADQGYTGATAAEAAQQSAIKLEIVKHQAAKRGFVWLPKRWVVERTFGWLGRFRRLARDYERLTATLAGWHWLAFLSLMLGKSSLKVHNRL
jgi:transposase